MEEKRQNNDQATDISVYVAALSATYKPASNAGVTTHWFSTCEVFDAIKEIDPGAKISLEQVHDALLAAGYRYQCRPGSVGVNFQWMFRAK